MAEGAKPFPGGNVGEILLLLTSPHPHGMGLGANGVAPETRLRERNRDQLDIFRRGGFRGAAEWE